MPKTKNQKEYQLIGEINHWRDKCTRYEAEVERLETMVRRARADSEALNIENKRYKEALEEITNDGGDDDHGWQIIAQVALDGDND